jgi:hypothetical protein
MLMKSSINFIISTLVFSILVSSSLFAQDDEDNKKFGISFSGFVKNDVFYDSRQIVSAREGHFLLWPKDQDLDAVDEDINATSSFNMLAVQSRLSGTITGPEAFGAKTSGKIEGDFFAQANDNINLFRLRHAFVKMDWENTQLLFGQYWNPMFVTSCFPGTVSFNTGSPIQPFARNPQVRLTQTFGDIKLVAAALAQRDYTSRAPDPSPEYLRNSGIPDMHLQLHYDKSKINAGAGIAYKTIVPRLETNMGLKTREGVSGLSALAYAKITLDPVTIKFQAVSGENTADVLQISGFAVKSIDPVTDKRTYTPISNFSVWSDIHTNGEKFQVGLFAGYLANKGAGEKYVGDPGYIYGFGNNISSIYRISPRIVFNSGKLRFGIESEYTTATFGRDFNEKAKPINGNEESNLRMLFSTYFFF